MENEKPINLFFGHKISVYFIKLIFGLCYIPDGMAIYISSQAKCHFYISLHYKQLSETLLTLFFSKAFCGSVIRFPANKHICQFPLRIACNSEHKKTGILQNHCRDRDSENVQSNAQ